MKKLVLAFAILAAGSAAAMAQSTTVQGSDLTPRSTVWSPWGVFRSLTVKDSLGGETKASQMSTPMSLNLRLGRSLSAVFYGAYAQTKLEPKGGTSTSLSGLTDIRARLFLRSGSGMVISAGVSLPTGKHSLTTAEETLAAVAANDVLGFRVRRYGEGVGAEFGLTRAFQAGSDGAFALGASAVYKGEYAPNEGSTAKYRPGSELSVSAGYDHHTPRTLVRLNASGRLYTKDQAGGLNVFKQAKQILLEERIVSTLGDHLNNDLSARQLLKGQDEFYSAKSDVPPTTTDNGSSVGISDRLELETSSGLKLAAIGEGSFYGKNETGYEKAHLLGFGGEIGYAASKNTLVRVSGKILTGTADPGQVKLSGMEGAVTLRASF